MVDQYHINLLEKYLEDQCTSIEKIEVEQWFENYNGGDKALYNNAPEEIKQSMARSLAIIQQKIAQEETQNGKVTHLKPRYILRWATAAAILLFAGIGGYFMHKKEIVQPIVKSQPIKNDIPPGTNKAILTLADNKHIILDDIKNGEVAIQGNASITKAANGQIIYKIAEGDEAIQTDKIANNTITTPKGGEWQVILPDGSHVWLNAASSITYPSVFVGKKRQVELTGEAYFEIAKNPEKPFIVNVNQKQQVEVLGTHFNIEAYSEDRVIKTTLLEGSVKLFSNNKQTLLKPGQMAINDLDESLQIKVKDADIDEVMAWKNGLFIFDYENIESIMKKISRWYDIDVVFKGNMKNVSFVGNYARYKSLSNLLKYIQSTKKVHFLTEGRRITVIAN